MNENALQFRRKEEVVAAFSDIERLDADAVAGEHQPLPGIAPDGSREHAAQPLEASGVPLEKCLQDGFGIAVSLKTVAEQLKLAADLKVVVNFTIEDDDRVAIFGKNRLIAACQIDDFKTGSA